MKCVSRDLIDKTKWQHWLPPPQHLKQRYFRRIFSLRNVKIRDVHDVHTNHRNSVKLRYNILHRLTYFIIRINMSFIYIYIYISSPGLTAWYWVNSLISHAFSVKPSERSVWKMCLYMYICVELYLLVNKLLSYPIPLKSKCESNLYTFPKQNQFSHIMVTKLLI